MTARPESCLSVLNSDVAPTSGPPHPLAIVLDNLRSAFNVGNIFRLAETCRVALVVPCGYTARPPHPKLAKTARGCETRVPCRPRPDSLAAVRELREEGYFAVGVETVADAPFPWDLTWRWPAALVLGNEALGVSRETLAACDAVTRLPVFGCKNSLNVGNCAAVVLYAALQQLLAEQKPRAPSDGHGFGHEGAAVQP